MKTIRCIIHVSVSRLKARPRRSASALLTHRAILNMAATMHSSSYRATLCYCKDPLRGQADSPHSVASDQNISEILAAGEQKTESLKAIIVRIIGNSGLRRRELAGLRWSDIDFNSGRAMLRATTIGPDHYVVLGPKALSALMELRRCIPYAEYVLGSDMPPVVRRAMAQLRVHGGELLSLRSLRRFFESWAARPRKW